MKIKIINFNPSSQVVQVLPFMQVPHWGRQSKQEPEFIYFPYIHELQFGGNKSGSRH